MRAEEAGVMLDFSSKFFLVSPSAQDTGRGLMRKSRFFFPSFFWDGPPLYRKTKAKEHLKNRKRGKKKERREEKKKKSSFRLSHTKRKKSESSLCTPSLSSLSLSLGSAQRYTYTQLTDRDIFFPLSRNNNRRKRREDRRFKPSSPPRRKTRLTAEPPWLCSRPRRSPRSRRAPTPA